MHLYKCILFTGSEVNSVFNCVALGSKRSLVHFELKHLFSLNNIYVQNTEEKPFGSFDNNRAYMSMVGRGSVYKHNFSRRGN